MFDLQKFLKKFSIADKPEPQKEWERVYRSMIVHTRGVKPTELLEIKRPNEPSYVRTYRLANYRTITKHGINQAIDGVYRVLSSSNYSIEYADSIKDYLTETKFKFLNENQDFHNLFFKTILRLIFDDPNGLLVWMPENPQDPELPPIANEETQVINVIPFYVCCKNIRFLSDDVVVFKGGEIVIEIPTSGGEPRKEKHDWFFICSHDFIWKYIPYWDEQKKEVKYKTEDWYSLSTTDGETDKLKAFPSVIWHHLGGNVVMNENEQRFYDSFYGCYVPFADEAICAFSDNQAVRVRYNFPFVEAKGQLCVSCKGHGKTLDKDGKQSTCTTCNGGGKVIPFSPHGEYINEPPTNNDNPDYINLPAIRFHSPDVAILDSSFKSWKELLDDARATVNLLFIDEAQSGVAKEIDREQKYETLIKITQNFFGLIRWSLEIIEAYRVPFADQRKGSKVIEPETFSIKTEGQLMAELNQMTLKETPQAFVATTSNQIAEKLYSDNQEAKIIIDILSKWDVLYGKSSSSISIYKATGAATLKDVLRNVHGYSILQRIAMTEDLTKMEPEEIIAKADAALELLMPKETLQIPEPENEPAPV